MSDYCGRCAGPLDTAGWCERCAFAPRVPAAVPRDPDDSEDLRDKYRVD